MPKEYFSIEHISSLSRIPGNSRIHLIGVAGVAMAQTAVALSEFGYRVSGSDSDFYEPMGSLLRGSNVSLMKGYLPENIHPDTSLVIIGNAVSYGNPEVCEVEKKGYKYSLLPKILYELLLEDKHSIVVSGTHGKTTTTGIIAHILSSVGADPSYFVGGVVRGLPSSLKVGSGSIGVIEGDEYDSAFFSKVPKFAFYKPKTLIITSVEYDHADIYPNLEAINKEFTSLVASVPRDGLILVSTSSDNLKKLIPGWKRISTAKLLTYGFNDEDIRITKRTEENRLQRVVIDSDLTGICEFEINQSGRYNVLNATAAFSACCFAGYKPSDISSSIAGFVGIKRRQEILFDSKDVTLIEDFAHHPTAVCETIKGIRERFPSRQLVAVFEPRSNTSRRKIFQNEYIAALSEADVVFLSNVKSRHNDEGVELLSVKQLTDDLKQRGKNARWFDTVPEILLSVKELGKGVIVVMSNGSFEGLAEDLREFFESVRRSSSLPTSSFFK